MAPLISESPYHGSWRTQSHHHGTHSPELCCWLAPRHGPQEWPPSSRLRDPLGQAGPLIALLAFSPGLVLTITHDRSRSLPLRRAAPSCFDWFKVMCGLRGQNAAERERLRQEHLRVEALQVSARDSPSSPHVPRGAVPRRHVVVGSPLGCLPVLWRPRRWHLDAGRFLNSRGPHCTSSR